MKSIAFAATTMLALAVPVFAWATPPAASRAARQPAAEMSAPSQKTMSPAPTAASPKGVNPAVWRQYSYDHAPVKLNGPNNGKPLTKLQVQQAQLDKVTTGAAGQPGTNAVVAQGQAIRQVGAEVFNGQSNPVIIKVAPQKVMLPDGKNVNAYRLADGNLYYKEPGTGTPTKLGFAAPQAKTQATPASPVHDTIARAYFKREAEAARRPAPNGMAASMGNK